MPTVGKNESKEAFVTRCTRELVTKEGRLSKQAVAICFSMYDEQTKKRKKK